ncbi:MAG: PQQ-like beta-propeller repeat protein [Verrucomicrobiales bacterium]|nr:PQQ-like beta-propeller repeat protein [Verrucomicrobiales bacterium]
MKIASCCLVLLLSGALLARGGDWPHFLGPRYDLHSDETGLLTQLPPAGPPVLWETKRGDGHASPVILGDALVFIHQRDRKEEVIECRDAATGKLRWEHAYAVEVGQNYGISDAPRSSPVIDPATRLVFTLGNDGDLIALALDTGKVAWQTRLDDQFGPTPVFFGRGSCPLVLGERLIVNVGSPGACVVAFDTRTGKVLWKAAHRWGASYASPVPGKVQGEDRVFVFAGGMDDPPTGGFLSINPANGNIDGEIPWRSETFASVNAASPVPCGENRVFITEDYGRGGLMIEFGADFQPRIAWEAPDLSCQFQTPIHHEGLLLGFGGSGGLLLCYEVATGRLRWSEPFIRLLVPWQGRDLPVNLGRGNLIHADGAFWCLGENGTLVHLDVSPSGVRVQSAAQLFYAPETWAAPVISNGRLYVNQSNLGSRLICYDFKAK